MKENREIDFRVMLRESEYKKLIALSDFHGLSRSSYMRTLLLKAIRSYESRDVK
jgi:uncharacterized protein YjbK